MIKITVEGPIAIGKSYFIKHYLMPAIRRACSDNFQVSMEGFTVVEKLPEASCNPSDRSHRT
jgi:hypothetical protein